MDGNVLYDDGLVTLDNDTITLHRYYFPLGAAKRIRYTQVRRVEVRDMSWWTGKGRLWGSSDALHFMPLDLRRWRKDRMVILDIGAAVRPAFTPDRPDAVAALITERAAPAR
jgi:hypothetical protein